MRKILICMIIGYALILAAEVGAKPNDSPDAGYCPAGTCNLQGVDGGLSRDVNKNCSAKNCRAPQKKGEKSR